VIGSGTSAFTVTAEGTTGTVLTGVTGNDPTFQAPAVNAAWTAWSPVITATTGTLTTTTIVTARQLTTGKTCRFVVDFNCSNIGTATGNFTITLPATSGPSRYFFYGGEYAINGKHVAGLCGSASTSFNINYADNGTTIATNFAAVIQGTYEIA
jgi:hypothetical protein